jgi:hypothetical protein
MSSRRECCLILMPEREIVSCNSMISGYAEFGEVANAGDEGYFIDFDDGSIR